VQCTTQMTMPFPVFITVW